MDHEGSRSEFLELLGQLGDPAFVRRAREVEEAERLLIARCSDDRSELLDLPKMRIGRLAASINHHWRILDRFVSDSDTVNYLRNLYDEWAPELKLPVPPTSNPKKIRQALQELVASFEFFNKRWREYLDQVSLEGVNHFRDDYNQYYVIEKACAFQSESVGRLGFKELPPFTIAEVLQHLPLLQIPEIGKS